MDLLKSPWFYSSPSPWSLAVYVILAYIGARLILSTGAGAQYKRWPRIMAFLDALSIVILVVLIQDTLWLVLNTIRWLPEYGAKMNFTYWMRYVQNIAAFTFIFYVMSDMYRLYFSFKLRTYGVVFLTYALSLAFVFILAPDPSFTDWTYAIRFGYSDFQILYGFCMGHIVGKLFIAWMFLSALSPIFEVKKLLNDNRPIEA